MAAVATRGDVDPAGRTPRPPRALAVDKLARRGRRRVASPTTGCASGRTNRARAVDFVTLPYPGLATDFQPILMAMLVTRRGDEHRHGERVRGPVPLRRRAAADGRRHPHRGTSRGDPRGAAVVGGAGARARHPRGRRHGDRGPDGRRRARDRRHAPRRPRATRTSRRSSPRSAPRSGASASSSDASVRRGARGPSRSRAAAVRPASRARGARTPIPASDDPRALGARRERSRSCSRYPAPLRARRPGSGAARAPAALDEVLAAASPSAGLPVTIEVTGLRRRRASELRSPAGRALARARRPRARGRRCSGSLLGRLRGDRLRAGRRRRSRPPCRRAAIGRAALTSDSTRRDGVVVAEDVVPTMCAFVGATDLRDRRRFRHPTRRRAAAARPLRPLPREPADVGADRDGGGVYVRLAGLARRRALACRRRVPASAARRPALDRVLRAVRRRCRCCWPGISRR